MKTIKKNNKSIFLNRSVLFEKCSKKDYILNSEKYLNNIGIGIYIWIKDELSITGLTNTYASASTKDNLYDLIKIYSSDILCCFYKTIISNENLKQLPQTQFNLQYALSHHSYLPEDKLYYKYVNNKIISNNNDSYGFQIYCMSKNIETIAGYKKNTIF